MEKPKTVRIFGQLYKITHDYKSDSNYGLTESQHNHIQLRPNLPEDKLKRVFMHELTHAVIAESLLCDAETFDQEQVCDLVGFHILDTLIANPAILKWVTSK